jgi:uncharacterized protein (DUF1015 family)
MASIHPFRALRYDPEQVTPSDVVTQPYDKITPKSQERYYAASPYNLVRLILGKREAGDNDQNNVYTRASAALPLSFASGAGRASSCKTRNPRSMSTPRRL